MLQAGKSTCGHTNLDINPEVSSAAIKGWQHRNNVITGGVWMIQGHEVDNQLEQSLIDIAVESWRFSRLFGKVVSKLDAGESGRYINQLRYFQKKVEENLDSNGLKLVNVEGQSYDAGMAASALNLGDFGPDDVLLVDQMLEPIIMGPNGLRKEGTVMLRKVEA